MEAVLPTPMGMWRAVHEVQAASSENMRSATGAIREVKGATWYLLLLLVLYAACANAEDSNSPPAVRTGIIRSAHRAFGALMLTPQIRKHQQYCMIVVTVKGSTKDLHLDSCCTRTIVSDASLLRNIRDLEEPRLVSGLTGVKAIHQIGDFANTHDESAGRAAHRGHWMSTMTRR